MSKLRAFAHKVRRDAHAVWIAVRDPRTPTAAKIVGGLVAAYAMSPIDLIPDFVPVLGWVDDLILIPIGVWLFLKLIPAPLFAEHLRQAEVETQRPVSRLGAALVVGLWLFILAGVVWSVWAWRYW